MLGAGSRTQAAETDDGQGGRTGPHSEARGSAAVTWAEGPLLRGGVPVGVGVGVGVARGPGCRASGRGTACASRALVFYALPSAALGEARLPAPEASVGGRARAAPPHMGPRLLTRPLRLPCSRELRWRWLPRCPPLGAGTGGPCRAAPPAPLEGPRGLELGQVWAEQRRAGGCRGTRAVGSSREGVGAHSSPLTPSPRSVGRGVIGPERPHHEGFWPLTSDPWLPKYCGRGPHACSYCRWRHKDPRRTTPHLPAQREGTAPSTCHFLEGSSFRERTCSRATPGGSLWPGNSRGRHRDDRTA